MNGISVSRSRFAWTRLFLSWVVTDVAIYLYFRHSPVMTRAVRVIDSDYDHKAQ